MDNRNPNGPGLKPAIFPTHSCRAHINVLTKLYDDLTRSGGAQVVVAFSIDAISRPVAVQQASIVARLHRRWHLRTKLNIISKIRVQFKGNYHQRDRTRITELQS